MTETKAKYRCVWLAVSPTHFKLASPQLRATDSFAALVRHHLLRRGVEAKGKFDVSILISFVVGCLTFPSPPRQDADAKADADSHRHYVDDDFQVRSERRRAEGAQTRPHATMGGGAKVVYARLWRL